MINGIKYQLVELVVPASYPNNRYTFDTQNFLRSKQIVSIEAYTVHDMSVSALGNVLPTSANFQQAYITFYGSDPENENSKGDWLQQIPLVALHRTNNGTDPYVFDLFGLIPRNIVWEKSFITTTAVLGNTAQLSWVFLIGYKGTEGD